MSRGVVIGKFYPPHLGHKFLVERAKAQCDELVVIVCHRKIQKISGELRSAWIREFNSGARVIVVDDNLPEDDSKAWAEYTKEILGYAPDVVFTSESYGDAYAKHLGARHILVDKERSQVPISATKIRSNPYDAWRYLGEGPRSYFAKRICIVGAESTGTTTMARALAEYYKTEWVPEYGRAYYETKMKSKNMDKWETEEFIHIAQQQNLNEDASARKCNKLLICDTDSFATHLWHERYMGFASPEVERISQDRKCDLYFLTNTDIPFVQDGTRDGQHVRQWMHNRFVEELNQRGKRFHILSGSHEDRMRTAISICDKVLRQSAIF